MYIFVAGEFNDYNIIYYLLLYFSISKFDQNLIKGKITSFKHLLFIEKNYVKIKKLKVF